MKKRDILFTKRKQYSNSFRVSELPSNLLPHDIIEVVNDEGFQSENESWDPYSKITIYRERDFTEAELEAYREEIRKNREKHNAERYQKYLRLKKEFEPE